MKLPSALCLLVAAGSIYPQQTHEAKGVAVRVTDLRGTPIWQAHVYVREILPAPTDTMHYVGDADRNGMILLPANAFARDVLVFDYGFKPWVGAVQGGSQAAVAVRMERAACKSPDGGCHNDEDALGPALRKHR